MRVRTRPHGTEPDPEVPPAMSYIDFEKLESLDPAAYQAQEPYPWANPEGILMERAYEWGELEVPDAAYVLGKGGRAVRLEGYPEATIADGMALDTEGRLYVTAQQGVQVLDASGDLLGTLKYPEQPANCAFGGADMRTLYVTAQTSVYSLAMRTDGVRLPLR